MWKREKELVIRYGYAVDGRDVSVMVVFFKTGQGWRIVKVTQN